MPTPKATPAGEANRSTSAEVGEQETECPPRWHELDVIDKEEEKKEGSDSEHGEISDEDHINSGH